MSNLPCQNMIYEREEIMVITICFIICLRCIYSIFSSYNVKMGVI